MSIYCKPPCEPNQAIQVANPGCGPCDGGGGGGIDPTVLAITSLNPNSAVCLTPNGTVTAIGQNYTATCELLADGVAIPGTYVTPTTMTFQHQASTTPTPKSVVITVRDGATAGQGAVPFNYTAAAALTLTQLIPNNAVFGSPDISVRALGTGFTAASRVYLDGVEAPVQRAFVSATELTFTAQASLESAERIMQVTVVDGSRTSNALPFNFTAVPLLLPIITCPVAPVSAVVGSPDLAVTVNGQNFTATSVVHLSGANPTAQTTQFVSATQLTFTAKPGAETARIGQVTVVDTGGTSVASCPFEFTPVAVLPIVTSLNPECIEVGKTTDVTLKVLGQNFLNSSVVKFDGVAQTTIYDSATELHVVITPAMQQAHTTVQQVTVDNSGQISTPAVPLTHYAKPTITSVFPDFLPTNNTAKQEVTITGTNFVATGKVFYASALEELPMTYVSATELKAMRDPATVGNESGSITVQTCGSIVSDNYGVQSNANPTLNLLDPVTGPVGTVVNVYAENAGAGTDAQVLVNNALVPTVMAGNIPTFTVTAGMTGTINVSVRTHVGNGDADVVAPPLTLPFVVT